MLPEPSSFNAPARSEHDCQATRIPSDLALILDHSEASPGPPAKKRSRTTADYTQRKRVPIACQFCRLRKVKCDNVRPSCGYCLRHEARCVYGEDAPEVAPGSNASENGASDQKILARLDEIKDMLERLQVAATPSASGASSTTSQAASNPVTSPEAVNRYPSTEAFSSHQTMDTSRARCSRPDSSPFKAFRCEAILKWPALCSIVPERDTQVDSFLLVPETDDISDERVGYEAQNREPRRGWIQEELTPLCRRFLTLFHPRNPILDGQLISHAKVVDENGLRWDSASCLVLLACALAVTTQPWKKPPETFDAINESIEGPFLENKAEAEAYFLAAKKRLGLLGDTLLDIQCLFLAFIYEKTYFRHLQSWFYLQQAINRLQIHLLKSGTRPWASNHSSQPSDLHIEQRVFWSCFRAEREFLFEIDLPPSGLGDLSYPDPLPEPPINFATSQAETESEGSPVNYNAQVEESGWCYYLAEISLRRTIDDTLRHLAEGGDDSWLNNPAQLVRQYHELEKQRSIWRYHLPAIVQFDEDRVPDNEFAHGLRGRFLEWHELLLRPILYHVLHLPYGQVALPECVELAERAVRHYVQRIHEYQYTLRHGGSWFITRRIFSYACLVLAAVKYPERIKVLGSWRVAIMAAVRTLRFWGRDAADVRHMASTLEAMYSAVDASRS